MFGEGSRERESALDRDKPAHSGPGNGVLAASATDAGALRESPGGAHWNFPTFEKSSSSQVEHSSGLEMKTAPHPSHS